MKKFTIAILVLCLISYSGFSQVKIQGTIVNYSGTGTTIRVYGKNNSATDLSNVLFGNINITFSITDQGASNPTDAQIIKASLIPSLDINPVDANNPYIVDGRAYYSYIMSNIASVTTTTTWLANTDSNPIAEFTFPLNTYFTTMRLDDLSPAGGPNGQMYWYVQVNGAGDITDYANMFYGTVAAPPTNNAQGSPSYVPLQPLSVLPVKFAGFNALKRDNDAMLTWQVENESPLTDRYEVERSLNGVDFRKVYTITAKNNGRSSNSYSLTDPNLTAIRPSGVFYYHIKQVDKDGHFIYSDIRNLRLNAAGMVLNVSPNPIRDIANITMDSEQDATVNITVTDASGKQVQAIKTQIFKGQNVKKVNLAALPIGTYMLKVQSPSETKTLSVVKGH